ncbi:cyclic nucleotide-binding protein [Sphingobacteriaceae bacterium]|nr:cyclic nucleotide-binding protein [Sphingobacteriaceae bacterium]
MIERIKQMYSLSDKKWKIYSEFFKPVQVPAKTILLKEGEVAQKVFYIEKGCIRVWFEKNGKDVTFQFFFEDQRISSSESFKNRIPSLVSIETLEHCSLWVISKKHMDIIISDAMKSKLTRDKVFDALHDRNIHYMKHSLSFIKDKPEERYHNLIKNNPQVIQRIPQHYIASYLGVSSVHLSRIKSKLAKMKH